ncbi:MAG: ATP-binding protein, partial [Gemmatimonadaceae bacterium]
YYRASGTADQVEGSGLGLTIVQDVVTSLGGRVWASFPDTGGSVFSFSVPIRKSAIDAAAESPATLGTNENGSSEA